MSAVALSAPSLTITLPPPSVALGGGKTFDIAKTADLIIKNSNGSPATAKKLTDALAKGQGTTIADALDRSVAARLRDDGALKNGGSGNPVEEGKALSHFSQILTASPKMPNTKGLTEAQKFDVYASVVEAWGNSEARTDLKDSATNGERVVVALRQETSTLANRGLGVYDDRMVVVWKDRDGTPHAKEFSGNTDPSAQYDARAGDSTKRIAASPGYEDVKQRISGGIRKIEGNDINKDGVRELGRLVPGTYKYQEKPTDFAGSRAFQVSTTQITRRDVNGDGRFNKADGNNIDTSGAGTTMYIHKGGRGGNTGSAGCQTVNPDVYQNFLNVVGNLKDFNYVLVNSK
jgi:hypothetical protein